MQVDAHDDDVNAVSFADETSNILLSGSDDGLCKVSCEDRQADRQRDGQTGRRTNMLLSGNDDRLC